jgi:hypothetical protein
MCDQLHKKSLFTNQGTGRILLKGSVLLLVLSFHLSVVEQVSGFFFEFLGSKLDDLIEFLILDFPHAGSCR